MILFIRALKHKIDHDASAKHIKVFSVHPGICSTNLINYLGTVSKAFWNLFLVKRRYHRVRLLIFMLVWRLSWNWIQVHIYHVVV